MIGGMAINIGESTKIIVKSIPISPFLSENLLIVTSKKLETLYMHTSSTTDYNGRKINNPYLKKTAFFIANLRRSTSKSIEKDKQVSIATPIFDNSDKIVGYIGFILNNSSKVQEGILICELLSRLITHEVSNATYQEKINNINNEFQIQSISDKEFEILKLIAFGKMDKEIAKELHISLSTVRSHISKIFEKLELNTRTQLVNYYLNEKIKYILRK